MSGEAPLRVRIVTVDFYSAPPVPDFDETYNHFRGSVIKQLPVIRIFGITPTGEKACVHMHGVLPYIYIPYPTGSVGKEGSLLYELAASLDEALNNSFSTKKHHVYKVTTVSAKAFYGYHSKEEKFLKIWFYHPMSIKRGVTLLEAGAVFGQAFQPHEAHVPYILQFFIDYNLYGMSFINLSHSTPRTPPGGDSPKDCLLKETTCTIEVDATAADILNLHSSSNALNPGLEYIREEEEKRNEEDGVAPPQDTPSDFRQFSPTPSDAGFRQRLQTAIMERCEKEISTDASEESSQLPSSSQPAPVSLDDEDMSVLKMLFGRLIADDIPDEDSVLGQPSQQEHLEETEHDLSQPYVSFIVDSDEENASSKDVNLSETMVWPEVDGLSQIDYNSDSSIPFVDGNMDLEKTPEKPTRRTRSQTSPRYVPLDIKLVKSPRRKKSKNEKEEPSSPELFRKLAKNVSELRSIKSPKRNVGSILKESVPSTSSQAEQQDEPDIIAGSDSSDNEQMNNKRKYNLTVNLLGNSSKSIPTIIRKKKSKRRSARKVLFGNVTSYPAASHSDSQSSTNPTSQDPKITDDDLSNHSEDLTTQMVSSEDSKGSEEVSLISGYNDTSTPARTPVRKGLFFESTPEGSVGKTITPVSLSKEVDQSDADTLDLDTTNYSQCTIMSFYGDTTMCFTPSESTTLYTPLIDPPSVDELLATLHLYGLEKNTPMEPFYGDPNDAPSSKEVGFNVISLKSRHPGALEEFKGTFEVTEWPVRRRKKRRVILEPAMDPPSSESIQRELELLSITSSQATSSQGSSQQSIDKPRPSLVNKLKLQTQKVVELERKKRNSGDIDATPNNSGMFKLDFQNLQDAQMNSLHKYTSLMVLEMHANTRGDLRPDPEYDAVEAVFYVIANDAPSSHLFPSPRITGGIIVCSEEEVRQFPFECTLVSVASEKELFLALIDLVALHNPDIIAGYEIEMLSWGYLIERGYVLGLNLVNELSRVKVDPTRNDAASHSFSNKDYDMRISGRIVLNVWRLMRHEVALQSYTFESIAYHVLHTRVPKFSFKALTFWWTHCSKCYRILVLKNYLMLVDGTEKILDQLNLVGRTGELASLFGIQFYEVFSRGSQFRVESMMLRLAKRLGYIAVSPNIEQRAHMRAPESLPLIMEPQSRFYGDPVIVLDFQSLYPSMIIAYNYCFSTCLGRVASLMESSEFKFGCTELKVPLKELVKLQENTHVSPAGVAFVDKSVRNGVLPQMLNEILQTRLLVKGSLKRHKKDKLLSRVLDARQLGLKLIANVTYGYTSANFSGRMPCIEIGDSVVSKGRETLERAIHLIENEECWRARVVYGDTDSMFVLCPGRSKEEAFDIGQQIADRVTAANPSPVKLKLEKVYQPCILQTKKRYVGYMYESADQKKPEYDAKGIETVRRDGCPAACKILEKSLKLLFESGDMSKVKAYVVGQMMKILSGRLSPAELTFAKEYRGASGYTPNAPVPALKIAKEMLRRDRRGEPRTSERVPYVVVCGPPGLPLIALVRSLPDYLADPSYVLNADYYISKAILPPLDRCFCLLGAQVFSWYSGLPKKQLFSMQQVVPSKRKATIAQYFRTVQCVACGSLTPLTLCDACQANPSHTISLLANAIGKLEHKYSAFHKICESCCGRNYEIDCISLDCPIYYRRLQATKDRTQTNLLYATIADLSIF